MRSMQLKGLSMHANTPIVRFDYRIPNSIKTNFLVKVSGRWYEIGFTDDYKDLHDKRVNIAPIGNINGIFIDDKWHTAEFNLYDMLRTKTGNTIIEEMVMADWDVDGYMKLKFGRNPKGATYYIDNFTITHGVLGRYASKTLITCLWITLIKKKRPMRSTVKAFCLKTRMSESWI